MKGNPLDERMQKIRSRLDKRIKQTHKNYLTVVGKKRPPRDMLLAKNALNGNLIFLKDQERTTHMHIIGSSGTGKSRFLEWMIERDIDHQKGLCLIDPHGDLYQAILKYVVRKRLQDRVILIDPNDEEWAVGLNYLEHDQTRVPSSHASEVMKGVAKVFGGEDTEAMPRLQRWERNALIPMVERKLTLIELADFVDPQNPVLRKRVLQESTNYHLKQEWDTFDNAHPRDRYNFIEAVQNRAGKFAVSENVRRIFGQEVSTINFRQAMDGGKIILCNLACTKMSQEEQKLLGVVIVDKIVQAGLSRSNIPESKRRPFYFYLDEFGEFVSDDIARALQELRKYKVSLILAHQELQQLKEDSGKVYSAVLANPQVRIAFRVSREDAEVMAKEIFAGQIRGDKVKRVIEQTKFRPIETTRTVHTTSHSYSEGSSTTDGSSSGSSSSTGSVVGTSQVFFGDGEAGILEIPSPITTSESSSEISTSGGFSSSSSSSTYGETDSWTESESEVPFYEFEEFKEVSQIQDYSIEEMVEKFIAWINTQPIRHAQLKVGTKKTVPIITPPVEEVKVREKDVAAFKERVYSQYALPAPQVDKMIAERREMWLNISEEEKLALGIRPPKKKSTKARRPVALPKE